MTLDIYSLMKTEKDIYKALCTISGIHWTRIETSTEAGIPDLNGIADGIEFWVELKMAPIRLRPAQVAWHKRALLEGRRAFVLCATEWGYKLYRVLKVSEAINGKYDIESELIVPVHPECLSGLTYYLTKDY